MRCPVCHREFKDHEEVREITAWGVSYVTCSSDECTKAFVTFLGEHVAHLQPQHPTKQ